MFAPRNIEFEGKEFEVDGKAEELNRIVLPDGRVLDVAMWAESLPPQPMGIQVVNHLFDKKDPQAVADLMNGVLAFEV